MSRRVLLGVAGAAIALLASAPVARAEELFVVPGGASVGDCTDTPGNLPCTLTHAVETVAVNNVGADEVIVSPGTYSEGDIEIDTGIDIHGIAGQARPVIVGVQAGLTVIDPAPGVTVSYLRLTGSQGIRINKTTTIDQVIAQGSGGAGCAVTPDGTASINLYNSVCIGSANNRGVVFEAGPNIVDTLNLRNVTAFAPGAGRGILVSAIDTGGNDTHLTVEGRNVIAESGAGLADVSTTGAGIANADLSFSNYDTVFAQATGVGSTATPVGTNDNQVAPPVFADADLHQAASSPTINVGSDGSILGLPTEILDLDGDMRIVGTSVDIGADEFVPVAPMSPTVPSNGFTVGPVQGKKLMLTLDSAGAVEVADGGGKTLKPSSATGGPGPITVALKLTKLGKRKLREKGKVRVKARITFTPNGGTAASLTQKLKIKSK